jgi:hypothetical protein
MPVLAGKRTQIPANVNVLGNIPNAVCAEGCNTFGDRRILIVATYADRGFDP